MDVWSLSPNMGGIVSSSRLLNAVRDLEYTVLQHHMLNVLTAFLVGVFIWCPINWFLGDSFKRLVICLDNNMTTKHKLMPFL